MIPKYKAIIVDDEKLALLDLKNVLSTFGEIEIVGEANTVDSAVMLINKLHPNLVFLDIQLRGESGFDLINKIDFELDFVFVTAYDKYAIRAFEVNAQDYLLKPVSAERIYQTIDKLTNRALKESESFRQLDYEDVIFLMLNNKYRFLKIDSIAAITSDADYTFVHIIDKTHSITRKTMREWESRLPENHFCRIHRETIVNLGCISKIDDSFSNSYKVFLKGFEKPFLMSRRYAAKIKEKFV
ncbi:MAG: LytTR family DNA-binding domain-containing protein [Ignavibacteriales bacterium]|nr:LytTR family DNA-binding domain-containing protein [Ignavibacteriales bacterium]